MEIKPKNKLRALAATFLILFLLIGMYAVPSRASEQPSFSIEASTTSEWFIKVPYTSVHWGTRGNYDFNDQNWGGGIGYIMYDVPLPVVGDMDIAYSAVIYNDSFYCDAFTAQVRAVKRIGKFGVGGSLNLAHKCIGVDLEQYTFVAPLLAVTYDMNTHLRFIVEGAPVLGDLNPTGFLALSLEWSF